MTQVTTDYYSAFTSSTVESQNGLISSLVQIIQSEPSPDWFFCIQRKEFIEMPWSSHTIMTKHIHIRSVSSVSIWHNWIKWRHFQTIDWKLVCLWPEPCAGIQIQPQPIDTTPPTVGLPGHVIDNILVLLKLKNNHDWKKGKPVGSTAYLHRSSELSVASTHSLGCAVDGLEPSGLQVGCNISMPTVAWCVVNIYFDWKAAQWTLLQCCRGHVCFNSSSAAFI